MGKNSSGFCHALKKGRGTWTLTFQILSEIHLVHLKNLWYESSMHARTWQAPGRSMGTHSPCHLLGWSQRLVYELHSYSTAMPKTPSSPPHFTEHLVAFSDPACHSVIWASNKVTQRNMTLPSLPASGLHLKDLLELCLKTAVTASYLFHAVICHFSERSVSGWTQGQDPKLCKHGGNSCSENLLDQVSADTHSTLAMGRDSRTPAQNVFPLYCWLQPSALVSPCEGF